MCNCLAGDVHGPVFLECAVCSAQLKWSYVLSESVSVFPFSSLCQWTLTQYILNIFYIHVLLKNPAGSFTLSGWNMHSHFCCCALVSTLWGHKREVVRFRTCQPCFYFLFSLQVITGSCVAVYASEKTFVLAVALQLEVVIDGGGRQAGLVDPAADWHGCPVQILELFWSMLSCCWDDRHEDKLFCPFLSPQHFTEFLDEFSPDVLGQLLNDPFLSEKNEIMEVELSLASPAPLIQAEHSYSLCGDSRPQSPLTHISTDDNFNEGRTDVCKICWYWCTEPLLVCHDDAVMRCFWWGDDALRLHVNALC